MPTHIRPARLLRLILLLSFAILGLRTTFVSRAEPGGFAQPHNDSGTPGIDTIALSNSADNIRSVAVRLDLTGLTPPVRLDSLSLYLEPPDNNARSFPLYVRIEAMQNNAPSSADFPPQTWSTRITLNGSGWYEVPLNPAWIIEGFSTSFIVSLVSQDLPWLEPPLLRLDDSSQIEINRNFYGQRFSAWQEHYAFWTDPETVGHLMVRANVATGADSYKTPTATASPSPTSTLSPTPTLTSTPSPTPVVTATPTPTRSPTSTATPFPEGILVELGASADAYIVQRQPHTNFGHRSELRLGYQPALGQQKIFLGGFFLSDLPPGTQIYQAELAMQITAIEGNPTFSIRARNLTQAWQELTINATNATDLWGRSYAVVQMSGSAQAGDWLTWDVTNLVQLWVQRDLPPYGIGLESEANGNALHGISFAAHEQPYIGPRLRIRYVLPTATPTPTTTPTASPTSTPSPTATPTASPTPTPSPTPTASPTLTPTPSLTPTLTASTTPTQTSSPTASATAMPAHNPIYLPLQLQG